MAAWKAQLSVVCSVAILPAVAAIVDFSPAGSSDFTLTYPDQFRHSGGAATSARPIEVVANLDELGEEAVITNRPVVFRIDSDLELTDSWTQNGGTFLKTGPGTLRFNFSGTSAMTMNIGPCCTASGKYDNRGSERFVLPADGTDPTAGFNGYTIYEGKFVVNAPDTTSSKQLQFSDASRSYFNVGDWIADEGEQEPDVEFVVEGGYVNIPAMARIGTYHGFKDYNTPNGRAKAQITVKAGATLQFSGGKQQYLGAPASRKFNNVWKPYNQKNVVKVEKGAYYNFSSEANFNVNTQPGCDSEFDVDGGRVYCPNIYHASENNTPDGERNLLIDIRDGSTFANLSLRNCVVTGTVTAPRRVDVRISSGGEFATEWVTNGVGGTFSFHVDGGTLATSLYLMKASDSVYKGSSSARRDIAEKILLDASIDGLYVSSGGVRVVSAGRTITASDPNVAVLAAPIMPDPDMSAGTVDGGVAVAAREADNGIVFAAQNSYHGPTVLESGIVTLRGDGDFSDSPVSIEDAKLCLMGGSRTVSSLSLSGRLFDLCLGPDASLCASSLDVGTAECLLVGFCDSEGAPLAVAQNDRTVLVFPTACRDAVSSLRIGMVAGSLLGIGSWRLVNVAGGFTELRVTAVPATEAGVPVFADGFVGTRAADDADYSVLALDADAAAYKPGTYVVAHYTRDGGSSLLDRFTCRLHSGVYASFSEELVASGEYVGLYEVKMTIVSIVPVSVNWTDSAAGDHSMSTSGNWEAAPASLSDGSADIALKSGEQMDVVANARIHGITNALESTNLPFVVNAADNALAIDGLFVSSKAGQLVLRGRITTIDDDTAGYDPSATGVRQITYQSASFYDADGNHQPEGLIGLRRSNSYWGVPLVLRGVTVDKPVYANGTMGTNLLYAEPNTTNVFDAPFVQGATWVRYVAGKGARIEFKNGFKIQSQCKKNGSGELRITGEPWSVMASFGLDEGSLVLDAEDCRVLPTSSSTAVNDYDIYTYESAAAVTIECLRSYCFKDGTDSISLENYLNRAPGSGYIRARTLELHATTQVVQRVRFVSTHADSRLKGDDGALLVINGGWETKRNYAYKIDNGSDWYRDTVMTNRIQTVGGLGFKLAGEDERLVLAGQDFQSSGVLEAAAGTIELAADASWRNGSDFRASGNGCLAFKSPAQINKASAIIRLSENGSVEIPSGVTLKVSSVQVKVGEEWVTVSSGEYNGTQSGLMYGRVTGGGTLRTGKLGMLFIIH